ncbi:hypothetical protein GCK72_014084 [Caenorhabditis remanei]|uniref:K Homology domain-containing protein n=1 Tax=Caenorhabditis remanei TaxID=31234 RepID=A0A6A5GQA4_CAERE|nr:hypothetical protein GCK72_014084 [Caenorhabditis remanei]KAF1757628.1 hypothetical protein GCK72_014084 [Caenorhabditis remanei]
MHSNRTSLYLDELLNEMSQLSISPIDFRNTRILLSKEISKVFDEMNLNEPTRPMNRYGSEDHKNLFYSPQLAASPSPFTPTYSLPTFPQFSTPYSSSFSKSNPFETPIKHLKSRTSQQNLGDWTNGNSSIDQSPYVLQTKIYIPEPPKKGFGEKEKYNYIGRILGPSGSTAQMIENQFNVTLLIRGAGSVRGLKSEEEEKKRKKKEPHLNEPLHVLLIARHNNKQKCEEILDKAAEKIESLLVPVHDDLKKEQLVRHAIMTGSYEPRTGKKYYGDRKSSIKTQETPE